MTCRYQRETGHHGISTHALKDRGDRKSPQKSTLQPMNQVFKFAQEEKKTEFSASTDSLPFPNTLVRQASIVKKQN